MSAKNVDRHNRFRSITVGFRVSPEEQDELNRAVALTYNDGSVLTIDCENVENHYDVTNGQMADLDWLLYNAAMEYASLVLSGEMENYLKWPALHGIEDS